jgi:hypothetical protein
MKKSFLILIMISFFPIYFADQVTIYNDNFSLVRTSLDLNLKQGLQSVFIDDIPSTIEANSVIIKPRDGKIEIFSQNYEYDLANTNQILQKYIGKEVELVTVTDQVFSGILQFNDYQTIGILNPKTKQLSLINYKEVRNLNLAELPANFFLKPTLHWQLLADKKGSQKLDFSYLCYGMMWNVTYNCVWNSEKKILDINSWVTITNDTGKTFRDSKLKLIAGDVNKLAQYDYDKTNEILYAMDGMRTKSAVFEEKEFHDFHLYTLSEKVTINNKQTKQLRLFPLKTVTAATKYEYRTFTDQVISIIEFDNSRKNGLGLALPKGIVKIYKKDEADNQLEFIGEDRLDHTPAEEKVKIVTGKAFDIVGETETKATRKISSSIVEKDLVVTLRNRSKVDKEIVVSHNLNGFWSIKNESLPYEVKNSSTIEFTQKLKSGQEVKLTWTERIEY